MSGPYLRDLKYTEWVCNADTDGSKIRLQSGWRDPKTLQLDIQSISNRMIDTQEKCIKLALISLGWTPPRGQG
jgi:hypothetical protein